MTDEAMSPLRRRMIEDMTIRKFAKTQHDDVQRVKNFAARLSVALHPPRRDLQSPADRLPPVTDPGARRTLLPPAAPPLRVTQPR
jgi:hypothetical protein